MGSMIQNSRDIHANLLEFLVEIPNQFAYQIAHRLVAEAQSEYNPLVFYGPRQSGKTHLLQAICSGIQEKYPDLSVLYLGGTEFCRTYAHSIHQGQYRQFRELCRGCRLFLLDDFQLLYNRESAQKELVFTINDLQQKESQIVFGTSFPLETSGFSPALLSRLQNGLALRLEPLSDEKVLEYCKERAHTYQVMVDDDVLKALWEMFPGSFGDFKIALHKLYRLLADHREKISWSIARQWIEVQQQQNAILPTFDRVLAVVANHFQLERPEDLLKKSGPRSLVPPRYIAIALARDILKMDVQELRCRFGQLSASAIRNALKKVGQDDNLQSALKDIRRRL